ncbi:baseplate J/gp47 family protein [Methanobrevibacter sp.]|uniref:baseplate J/gp47 family protein n=1 Tax=Methanobrevibacter sp. TaxID=66852 RepID=UPI00388FC587
MNYSQKYYEEIFEKMLNDSVENGLISHAEDFTSYIENKEDISNYYVMDKSVIAEMFASFYEDLTAVYNSIDIDIAEGKDLDNLGKIVGISRPMATYAMAEITFTISQIQNEEEIIITDEIIVSTEKGIQYRTLEEVYIPIDETSATVQAIALEPGISSKVIENTLTNIESEFDIEGNITCTNMKSSSGGSETYTDSQYRELLKNWIKINLKGSNEAYEYYFASFDGIDGYRIVPNWDVTGTVKVIIDPGTDYQLNEAYEGLQNIVSQATEDIIMFAPTEKLIDVYAIINVDIDQINPYSAVEKEQIKSKILASIKTFIDGGYTNDGMYYIGLEIGEDFIPHKLAVFLDEEIPELKSITFNYPTDYIPILDDEKGVSNNITIEMI